MTKALLRRHLLACATERQLEQPALPSDKQKRVPDTGIGRFSPYAESSLRSWFDPLDMNLDSEKSVLSVHFPHPLFGQHFARLFRPLFEQAARQVWGQNLTILYDTDCRYETADLENSNTESGSAPVGQKSTNTDSPMFHRNTEGLSDSRLSETVSENVPLRSEKNMLDTFSIFSCSNAFPYGEEWTFDTFIANGKHKWALSLIREATRKVISSLAASSSGQKESPGILVLCGQHGTGKTHMLRAMGNELFRTLSSDLLYISLSELELLFASAPPPAVRQKLTEKRVILIDDFQYLSRIPEIIGTTSSEESGVCFQEELCLLIDRFMDQGKLLVVAGVGHPRDWNLHRALLSRLETGLWSELPEPDLDVRLRYVQQQVRQKRLPLLREHMMLLAQHCLDIRKLSGVIRRVASHRSLVGHDLTEQDILDIIRQSGDRSPLTAQQIISIVGEYCEIAPRDILGEKRHPNLVLARQLSMYLCRELLGHSYPVIGRMFGGKDHSTVMHSVKKIKSLQENDRIMHTMVTELTKACRERID